MYLNIRDAYFKYFNLALDVKSFECINARYIIIYFAETAHYNDG